MMSELSESLAYMQEVEQLRFVIKHLQRENDALIARVARLEHQLKISMQRETKRGREIAESVLAETPQQSLAAIEAAAVEKYNESFIGICNQLGFGNVGNAANTFAAEYVKNLRQQGGE